MCAGRNEYYTDGACRSNFGGLGEDGCQNFGEEEMAKDVGSQLNLVTLGGYGSCRRSHDAGVQPKHIQPLLLLQELGRRCFNSPEIAQI